MLYIRLFIIIDKFIKWGYFIAYIKEVFIKYKVLIKIILDRNIKFIVAF